MNKIIAGVFYVVLSIIATNAGAVTTLLTNYAQLVKALEQADDVKGIIKLDFCEILEPELQAQLAQNFEGATTRVNFTHFLHYKPRAGEQLRDTVITTTDLIIENTPGVFLKMVGRLNVYDDNTAILKVSFYNHNLSTSYLVVDMECDISNGRDENALLLYDFP